MSKKQIWQCICLLLMGMLLLSGCGQSKKEVLPKQSGEEVLSKQSKREILSQYKEDIKPIMAGVLQSSKEWDELRSKSIKGEISNSQFYAEVERKYLPNWIQLQERMEKIVVHKELRDIHEIGIKMLARNILASTEIIAAFYNNDMSKITSANQLLSEAKELERTYVNKLDDFAK